MIRASAAGTENTTDLGECAFRVGRVVDHTPRVDEVELAVARTAATRRRRRAGRPGDPRARDAPAPPRRMPRSGRRRSHPRRPADELDEVRAEPDADLEDALAAPAFELREPWDERLELVRGGARRRRRTRVSRVPLRSSTCRTARPASRRRTRSFSVSLTACPPRRPATLPDAPPARSGGESGRTRGLVGPSQPPPPGARATSGPTVRGRPDPPARRRHRRLLPRGSAPTPRSPRRSPAGQPPSSRSASRARSRGRSGARRAARAGRRSRREGAASPRAAPGRGRRRCARPPLPPAATSGAFSGPSPTRAKLASPSSSGAARDDRVESLGDPVRAREGDDELALRRRRAGAAVLWLCLEEHLERPVRNQRRRRRGSCGSCRCARRTAASRRRRRRPGGRASARATPPPASVRPVSICIRLTAADGQRSRTSSTNGARFSRASARPATPVKSGGVVATTTSARPAIGAIAVASAMYER